MLFTTDQQTLDDLNIFGRNNSSSIYGIFNRTHTRGGAALLEEMFRFPLSDVSSINGRVETIQFFAAFSVFPFDTELFDIAEQYLDNLDERTKISASGDRMGNMLSNLVLDDANYKFVQKGVSALMVLIGTLRDFITSLDSNQELSHQKDLMDVEKVLRISELAEIVFQNPTMRFSYEKLSICDQVLRFQYSAEIKKLLRYIYHLDVYLSVGRVAAEHHFVFPRALPGEQQQLLLEGLYHPKLDNPVANDLLLDSLSNLVFLTGANMAGKSTFMKSMGIAMFLAHMGFPVPAASMRFSVMDGIYTTINLPDNLNMGTSHFYAEVLRIKKIAKELSLSKRLFVVIDELFRGTNVKDAYEGTVLITAAFTARRDSIFIISTHIIEAAEVLKERCRNISFRYLPTLMEQGTPVYTHRLEEGVTADRHGMVIINNEGILGLLEKRDGNAGTEINFVTDKQTLDDLNLLGKYKPNSSFSFFNHVHTGGGEKLLEQMFLHPLTNASDINSRSDIFNYFQGQDLEFPFDAAQFAILENYLSDHSGPAILSTGMQVIRKQLSHLLFKDEQYQDLLSGIAATAEMLRRAMKFIAGLTEAGLPAVYKENLNRVRAVLTDRRLFGMMKIDKELPLSQVISYDYLIRYTFKTDMEYLVQFIYELDVYISVSHVARQKNLSYATALPKEAHMFKAVALRHPGIDKAVANPVSFDRDKNVIFLTGANMAGKSTFMKTVGVSLYLAHMGFPVGARSLTFSVMDGIYSSINVPDNLSLGYSHFYAEVLRVKNVAKEVSAGKNLLVIFDELFKGTNVKDAYDATHAVTSAFSEYRNCSFIISTHIIEVGEELQKTHHHLRFLYLPTVMNGNVPRYTYLLQEGITTDRQGMTIIENEGILEMLKDKTAD